MVRITTKSAVEIGGVVHRGGQPFDVEASVAESLSKDGVKFSVVKDTASASVDTGDASASASETENQKDESASMGTEDSAGKSAKTSKKKS